MKIIRHLDEAGQICHAALLADGTAREIVGDLFGEFHVTSAPASVRKLLAPIAPPAIFAIGLNYRSHIGETNSKIPGHPVLFMKSPGAVQNPGDPIELPRHLRSDQVDYEVELAIVIGRACKNVSVEKALDFVLGYTVANDVSARDWQKQWGGGQFCRGKTFDTFCPLGPCLVTPEEIPDPQTLALRTIINGEELQSSTTAQMIFPVAQLISFLSGSTTLLPGTVILTGTPEGVGMARNPPRWLVPGDEITCEIDGIGALTNPVVEEAI
jgi:2-keto-4-pentenoate hydratase/2-oxohepta-3-ene-1,7-dioic acid hydratase in catechol pathway